jgi:DNA polymerase I
MNSTLILVDGMAVLYRAYYAIQSLSTKSGRPTNAVFGFIRMMKQLRDVLKPTHWAVAFDGGLPENRLKLLDQYKAQRPAMPAALKEQILAVEQYLDGACVTRIRQDRQEADDVIASMAIRMSGEADRVLIATGDKDMYQLVTGKISVVAVSGNLDSMGPAEVKRKMGVDPSQIVDLLALVGDSSDNIPGVPGVGPKTAARLLQQYGSITELLAHLDDLPEGKVKNAIRESRDIILRNVELVTLRGDLDCPFIWDDLKMRGPDTERLIELFRELEFGSMAKELMQQELFAN